MATTATSDVIVVGAGFAGLTAARELSKKGLSVHILEARDPIGGRTWLEPRLGRNLELGGTWVHWIQPHVWAEMSRYGIGVMTGAEFEKTYWYADGRRFEGSPSELMTLLDQPNRDFLAPSRGLVPLPYEPLSNHAVKGADQITIAEKITELDLDPVSDDLMRSFWSLNFNGKIEEAAYTQGLRWASASCHEWPLMFEACATYKIQGGTGALAQALLEDSSADLRLNTPVKQIRQTTRGSPPSPPTAPSTRPRRSSSPSPSTSWAPSRSSPSSPPASARRPNGASSGWGQRSGSRSRAAMSALWRWDRRTGR